METVEKVTILLVGIAVGFFVNWQFNASTLEESYQITNSSVNQAKVAVAQTKECISLLDEFITIAENQSRLIKELSN